MLGMMRMNIDSGSGTPSAARNSLTKTTKELLKMQFVDTDAANVVISTQQETFDARGK